MSHTSRRGPPIECPLASLGRNTPTMTVQPSYHHPLSSSPLNPQVYQMSRNSPILATQLNSSKSEHDEDITNGYIDTSNMDSYRTAMRNYIPTESMFSYQERLSPVAERSSGGSYSLSNLQNNDVVIVNHTDEYFLDDKLNSLYIRDDIRSHPVNSERYYLEENMDNMSSSSNFQLRASSPSETSGSDRYFIGNRRRDSPAGMSGSRSIRPYRCSSNHQIQQSTSVNLVDGLTRLGRFSPSLDQGYATLVSPSPSGQQTPSAWTKKPPSIRPSSGSGFDRLPDDAILRIFYWLDSCELCQISRVCRRFESLAWKPILWKIISLKGDSISGDKALKSIFRRLCGQSRNGSCPEVERVMLNEGCRLSDKGLQLLGKRCPELTHLQIHSSSHVTNNTLFDVVSRCTNLRHLDISGCSQITTLNFYSINEPPRRFLLQYLDLTDCSIVNDCGLKIVVKNCPQLNYLYLRRCVQITDAGLKFVPSFCIGLRELSVSDCCGITDFGLYELAKLGATLRYLSVAKCDQVSDAGLKVIARRCYKLRYLNARGCEAVSDDSITVLAQSCPRLRALDIGKCDVSDAGLRALAESCPNLKKISLRNCDMITDRGIQCIAYYCRGLQQLNIQDCQISLEGYRAVKKYCKRCVIEHTNPGFC